MKKNISQKLGIFAMILSIILICASTASLVTELTTRKMPYAIIAHVYGVILWSMWAIDGYLLAKKRDASTAMTIAALIATAIAYIVVIVSAVVYSIFIVA